MAFEIQDEIACLRKLIESGMKPSDEEAINEEVIKKWKQQVEITFLSTPDDWTLCVLENMKLLTKLFLLFAWWPWTFFGLVVLFTFVFFFF